MRKRRKHRKIIEVLRQFQACSRDTYTNGAAFYYEFLTRVNFYETDEVDTAAASASRRGLEIWWNNDFIESLNHNQVRYILIHEMFHLLNNHLNRLTDVRPIERNIVGDEIINSEIERLNLDLNLERPSTPILNVPAEYEDEWVLEKLWAWHNNRAEKNKDNQSDSDQNQSSDQKGSSKGGAPQNQHDLQKQVDDIFNNAMTEEEIKDFIKRMIDEHGKEDKDGKYWKEIHSKAIQEILKNKGINPGELTQVIERLQRTKIDYLKIIKSNFQRLKGLGRTSTTFSRPNKRNGSKIIFKGRKKEANNINIILDVSGSMHGTVDKMLNILYRDDLQMTIAQSDVKITKTDVIKSKKDFKDFELVGFGGTMLQPAVDYFRDNNKSSNLLIITDGWTDTLDFDDYDKKVLIITTHDECPLAKNYKNVTQLKVPIEELEENLK